MLINGRKHILVDKESLITELETIKHSATLNNINCKIDSIVNNLKQCT